MKFLLLKTLLLRKHKKDEGFTLPIVIAIGFVMVLLSAVDLVQSGEENLNAISQRGSSDALAAAELGVARYRDLLNNNRLLAVNNSDQWISTNTLISDRVCTAGIFGTGGWADTDLSSENSWHGIDVDGDNINDYEYRLVSYEYERDGIFGDADGDGILDDLTPDNNDFSQNSDTGDIDQNPATPPVAFDPATNNHNDTNNDGTSDAGGILIVQGRDTIGSIAQLQVLMPIGVNTQELTNFSPALWIEKSTVANIGNVDINSDGTETGGSKIGTKVFSESTADADNSNDGNIVLYEPAASNSTVTDPDGCNDPADLSQETTISSSRTLPDLVDIASITNKKILTSSLSSNTSSDPTKADQSNYFKDKEIVLGTSWDDSEALNGDRYYYSTNAANLEISPGQSILVDGTSKVILYVGESLNIDTGTASDISFLANSQYPSKSSAIARYLEIHVKGDVNITGDGTLDITGLLRVNGTVNIEGDSKVNVIGSIWTKNWGSNSGTVTIDTDQSIDNTVTPPQTNYEYQFYSITPDRTPAPLTFRPSGWERQEATN